MLNLHREKQLADHLSMSVQHLRSLAEQLNTEPDTLIQPMLCMDTGRPEKKPRHVINVRGKLREFQYRLYRRLLVRRVERSQYSFGGIPGRSIKDNAAVHSDSVWGLTADIANFYPSISADRVYRLFVEQLGCAPNVSRILTRLCTYRFHLALGLITSPMLAELIVRPIDQRIALACEKHGLRYSRFVDDMGITGHFDLSPQRSGLASLIETIFMQNGMRIHPDKTKSGRLDQGLEFASLRIKKGKVDISTAYAEKIDRQIDQLRALAANQTFEGPFYVPAQVEARIHFVGWINPGRKRHLMRKFRPIDKSAVLRNARARGLVRAKKMLLVEQPA